MRARSISAVVTLLFLAACDEDAGPQPGTDDSSSSETVARAWRSAMEELERTRDEFEVELTEADGFEVRGPCPEGGALHLEGSVTSDAYDFTASFSGCASGDLVIDGDLSVFGSTTASSTEFGMTGRLEFSGQLELACSIDIEGSTEVSQGSAEAELRGSVCGHDADVIART